MSIRNRICPLGKLVCPWPKNAVLLDIRHNNPETVLEDMSGRIFLYAGRYLLELVSGGGSGGGWQNGNVWAGGGSGAAIKIEIKISYGFYNYCAGGATPESGYLFSGGNGKTSFFKSSNQKVNFELIGGVGAYGAGGKPGGLITQYSEKYIRQEFIKTNGITGMGWSDRPGGVSPGAASVYAVDGFPFGAGGGTLDGGKQGFLRLTRL